MSPISAGKLAAGRRVSPSSAFELVQSANCPVVGVPTIDMTDGTTHVPSPRQNVEEDAPVPLLKLPTESCTDAGNVDVQTGREPPEEIRSCPLAGDDVDAAAFEPVAYRTPFVVHCANASMGNNPHIAVIAGIFRPIMRKHGKLFARLKRIRTLSCHTPFFPALPYFSRLRRQTDTKSFVRAYGMTVTFPFL
jgi:hypothetical protein